MVNSHKHTQYQGLTADEVAESRRLHGANVISPAGKESLWRRFFEKLTGPFGHFIPGWNNGDSLIFVLEIAALLSIFIAFSEYFGWMGMAPVGVSVFFEPVGILLAIFLATGIAFYFEVKADHEFSLLNQVNDEERVQVVRDGQVTTVERKDIVVGDVVLVNQGDEVPADAELLEAVSLHVDESTLTGELLCEKTADPGLFNPEATFPSNHVLKGTRVMEGHAVARVFAVGDQTESGKVMAATHLDNSVKTPLNEQLDRLGGRIAYGSYAVAALVIVCRIGAYLMANDFVMMDFVGILLQTIMIAVTLTVVAVPEGLPMAVTLSLAYSMRRMLRSNNLVRRMHACETMGATTVICTDKTGTLTKNQMQVAHTVFFSLPNQMMGDDEISGLVKEGMAVNTTAHLDLKSKKYPQVIGNPTEGALLLWLHECGVDYAALRENVDRVAEMPFSTERKMMATAVKHEDGVVVVHLKGAPEMVLSLCREVDGGVSRDHVLELLDGYQRHGYRTLALAYKKVTDRALLPLEEELDGGEWHFLGVVAISDPVREDVPPAIRQCLNAGIRVMIVTGDNVETAKQTGRQIGLWNNHDADLCVMTGPELAAMTDEELDVRVDKLKIVARARPMDKKRLVEALQRCGQVVAVTGDGTNDAPALKAAHVGLSMGSGTAVAKEASDITIIDNSFVSIGRAVLWGRSLYQNIQRFIQFQLTVNVAACLIVLAGAAFGMESPLSVTQMLWVNLIMDTFAGVALASLPPSQAVMHDKPRDRKAFIIDRHMAHHIFGTGLTFTLILFGLLFLFAKSDVHEVHLLHFQTFRLDNTNHLTPYELSVFFTVFVMLQFWNMFNARATNTGHSAFHRLRHSRAFMMIAAIVFFGQIAIVTFGGDFFNTTPLSLIDWLKIIFATSFVLLIGELLRYFLHKDNREGSFF